MGLQYQGKYSPQLLRDIGDKRQYFMDNELLLIMSVDFHQASVLIQEHHELPFLRLMVTDDFPNLSDGIRNRLLVELSKRYKMWLGNLGSDASANLAAVLQGCYDGLVLDEAFTDVNRDKPIFQTVLNEMNKYCNHLIVPGINTGRYRHIRLRYAEQLM
ncbi:hypothetical protein R0H17_25205 [Phytobacter diazotrophicus]|uniref:hypothetical protein n=1 Tax=Phytobacter diazotrophicus TaxID=395631 RepID=UPI002935F754|nr:hypothetical protein [Phytobacter diazotrophicus]MDV2904923.1 hypothetical protein [Phytobacter diazotrophicus]